MVKAAIFVLSLFSFAVYAGPNPFGGSGSPFATQAGGVSGAEFSDPGVINTSTNPVDWSKLKNVPAGFADGTDDTGAPPSFFTLSGYNSTLPSGTTFQTAIYGDDATITRIVVTILEPSFGGTGDTWYCGDAGNKLSITTANGSVKGSRFSSTGTQTVNSGNEVNMWMTSVATVTASANVACVYEP
jgi:hypothetical protein